VPGHVGCALVRGFGAEAKNAAGDDFLAEQGLKTVQETLVCQEGEEGGEGGVSGVPDAGGAFSSFLEDLREAVFEPILFMQV